MRFTFSGGFSSNFFPEVDVDKKVGHKNRALKSFEFTDDIEIGSIEIEYSEFLYKMHFFDRSHKAILQIGNKDCALNRKKFVFSPSEVIIGASINPHAEYDYIVGNLMFKTVNTAKS